MDLAKKDVEALSYQFQCFNPFDPPVSLHNIVPLHLQHSERFCSSRGAKRCQLHFVGASVTASSHQLQTIELGGGCATLRLSSSVPVHSSEALVVQALRHGNVSWIFRRS